MLRRSITVTGQRLIARGRRGHHLLRSVLGDLVHSLKHLLLLLLLLLVLLELQLMVLDGHLEGGQPAHAVGGLQGLAEQG